ncbi:MAG TPA: protein kinase [Steroidobacteraceae bacterium]|jgi:TonB family protein|nr:protein kinase [Steroidobacteraceae bacterium]
MTEARESTSEAWTRWQGQAVNGVFPLERYLGCSDHSGVFFTRSTAPDSTDLAIKLVPTTRSRAASQLPRWKRAAGVTHAQLLRLLEWGGCQLEGSPHLYAVMEYADQTLAQLLEHRRLTEDEAREMLPPILEALEFLHGQNLVQGQLKPSNILVVGDQIKLASDTIRRAGESAASSTAPTAYDPPEARRGGGSTADDIWALGVTLSQALTGRLPESSSGPGEIVSAADFPPAFRELVERCLLSKPEDRPAVAEILAWAQGRPLAFELARPPGPSAPAPSAPPPPASAEPAPDSPSAAGAVAPDASAMAPDSTESLPAPAVVPPVAPLVPPPSPALAISPASPPSPVSLPSPAFLPPPASLSPSASLSSLSMDAPSGKPRSMLGLILGVIVVVALAWYAWRLIGADRSPAASSPASPSAAEPAPPAAAPAATAPTSQAPPGGSLPAPPAAAASTAPPSAMAASSPGIHEVLPDVSPTARRSIRGHIKVWVRVVVEADGSVLAAAVERASSSGYFRRVAAEAAKQWTFPPADTQARRVTQIQFDFSRDQTIAHAGALR